MKHIFSIILLFSVIFFASLIEAKACWCRKDPEETNTPEKLFQVVTQDVRESALVFSGKVVERSGEHLKFEVQKIWKGEDRAKILFTSLNYVDWSKTGRDGFIDSCAYYFKTGESYLVYAVIKDGKYETSKCGRTQLLSAAEKDIEKLDAIKRYKKWLQDDILLPAKFRFTALPY